MNIFDPNALRDMFNNISRVVSTGLIGSRIGKNISSFTGISLQQLASDIGVAHQFQQKPFTANDAKNIYGDLSALSYGSGQGPSSTFLDEYSKFQEDYFRTVSDKRNLAMGKSASADVLRKMGKIDLSVLNYSEQKRLKNMFFGRVLKGADLFNEVGLPGISMPSSNLYRQPFRMSVGFGGNEGVHPVQVLLSRMIFNIDPKKTGLDAINFSSSDMMTTDRLLQTTQNVESMLDKSRIANLFRGKADVVTLDVETAGVFRGAQVRSMAIAEMGALQVGKNVPSASVNISNEFNVLFESPQMRGVTVNTLNGGASTLNAHIAKMEGAVGGPGGGPRLLSMGDQGEVFLDEATKFLERLTKADVVTGHNINFDIDKIVETMQAMPGFANHTKAVSALSAFLERKNESGYILDTLDVARTYLEQEANQIIDSEGITDVLKRSQKFVETVYSKEVLSRVTIGGSASWASVENISLNTNLLDLIYDMDRGATAAELLQGGAAHTSEVDVKLQSYIMNFIHTGELKFIRDPNQPMPKEKMDFVNDMRTRILRSTATTPTTNIADVQHLSRNVLDSILASDELSRKVSLVTKAEDVLTESVLDQTPSLRGTVGVVGFSEREGRSVFSVAGQEAVSGIDLGKVRGILQQAAQGNKEAADKITDLGISLGQASRAEELFQLRNISRPAPLISPATASADQLTNALTSLTSAFAGATRPDVNVETLRMEAAQGGNLFNLFGVVPDYTYDQSREIAKALSEVGSPFAGLVTIQDQIFSAAMSQATAKKTFDIGDLSEKALFEGEATDVGKAKNFFFTKYASQLSELGLSTWDTQSKSRMFSYDVNDEVNKILMPTNVAKEAYSRLDKNIIRQTGGSLSNIGLSVVDGQDTVNLVWHISRQLDDAQTDQLAKNILDILDEQRFLLNDRKNQSAELMDDLAKVQDIRSKVTVEPGKKLSEAAGLAQQEAFQLFTKGLKERGAVIGSITGQTARSIIASLLAMNIPIDNDVILSQFRAQMLDIEGLSDKHIALSMFTDAKAARVAGTERRISEANQRFVDFLNQTAEKIQEIQGGQLEGDFSSGLLRRLSSAMPEEGFSIADFYRGNKRNLRLGAAGLAAAVIGYYGASKYEERQLYNESFEQQPYERGRQVSAMNDYSSSTYSLNSPRMDPLVTAGVVGNLDRSKVNHTSMNPFRNNNLFGGQL